MNTEPIIPSLMLFTLIAAVVIASGSLVWFLRKRHNRELAARAFKGDAGTDTDRLSNNRRKMYEIHSNLKGASQAIKRNDASSALSVAAQLEMDGHSDIMVKGSDERSFTLDEFRIEAGGSAGRRDESQRADVLDRHSDVSAPAS